MKGVVSMIVEVIEKYPLLVIFMLVLLLVMTFVIVYYRMSKKYEKSQIELKESLLVENEHAIDDFKKETEASLKTLDSMYTANKDLWIESIFNHIVKE